jgi:hypothetical protein
MKKVKLNLVILEKEFALLDEKQKSNVLGGSYYYDSSTGSFLEKIGSSDQVRFISLNDWKFNAQPYNNGNLGTDFSGATDNTREKFFLNQLPSNVDGIDGINIKNVTGLSNYDAITGFITTDSYDTTPTFVYRTNDSIWNDYYDMKNMMLHESYHLSYCHQVYEGGYDNDNFYHRYLMAEREIEAILAQVTDSYYDYTSDNFRKSVADQLLYWWRISDYYNPADAPSDSSGHTWEDAWRICQISGYI